MTAQPAGRFALAFIFLTMLIDTMGLGLIIPVSPGLIRALTHEDLSGAARWGGWLFFVYALMQFLCAPAIGNLSDRFGRRVMTNLFGYFTGSHAPVYFPGASFFAASLFEPGALLLFGPAAPARARAAEPVT